jgi:hypothetical protein
MKSRGLGSIVLALCFFSFVITSLKAQTTSPVGVDSVVITFSGVPSSTPIVQKAALKYNKDFAMSFQEDDALSDIFNEVYPAFEGKDNQHGMFFSDGCGNAISFKMSSGIYVFAANNTDLLNPDDPYHDNTKLTWNDLKTLYRSHWGIENHGLFDTPNLSSAEIIDYAFKRTQSYGARKISDSVLFKTFVIPNNIENYVNYLADNQYHAALNQGQDNSWIGFGFDGFDVESDTINWLKRVKLNRLFIQSGFKNVADALYLQSQAGIHKWYLSGMHQVPGAFLSELNQIYQTYGQPGLDNILIASDDEILDYLAVKQATQVVSTLHNDKLKITFSGNVPTDRLYYALSLNIIADKSISSIQVYGTDTYSTNGVGKDTALVNLSWQGRKYLTVAKMADSTTAIALQAPTQYNGLVAMDYVQLLPDGQQKITLQKQLCGLDRSSWTLSYDAGFCNPVDLGNDTSLCAGSCVTLNGPDGMKSYSWKNILDNSVLGSNAKLDICPKQTMTVSLSVLTPDNVSAADSIKLTVLPAPSVALGNDTIIKLGDSLVLQAPTGVGYQYLWSTGSTDRTIICKSDRSDTLSYALQVEDANHCQSEDTIKVIFQKILDIPQVATLFDTVRIAPGDVAHLVANSAAAKKFIWRYSGTVDTTLSGHLFFNPGASMMVYVKACNDDGCSNEDSTYVKVVPISSDILPADTTVCSGSCFALYGPENMTIYKWEVSGIDTIIGRRSSLEVCAKVSAYYFLTVIDRSGHILRDSMQVTVLPSPDARIQYSDYKVCEHTEISLSATAGYHYLWIPSGDTTREIRFVVNDTLLVHLKVTNNMGCANSDSLTIYSLPQPKVNMSDILPAYCPNDPSVILSGDPPDGDFSGDGVNGNVFFPFLAGPGLHTLYYTVANEGGCPGIDSTTTFVYGPIPEINLQPADTTLLENGKVTYDAGPGFNDYYWTTGDTTRIVNIFYSDYSNGTDTITVIGLAGACTSVGSAVIHFGETTGLNEFSEKEILVFPNPNQGKFSITWPASNERITFIFSDMAGHQIMRKEFNPGVNQLKLSVPGLTPGLYLIRIQTESRFWIKKMMVR